MESNRPPARELLRGRDVGEDHPIQRAAARASPGRKRPATMPVDFRPPRSTVIGSPNDRPFSAASPSEINSAPGRVRKATS